MAEGPLSKAEYVISYMTLRKVIGVLGLALPFVLAFGAILVSHEKIIQGSISYYYHTGMRDVFVGMLFAIGFFLLSYRGPERADHIAGPLAWVFALGVALFPTSEDPLPPGANPIIGVIHFIFATLFFGTLIYFSVFLFTKTHKRKKPTKQKLLRNGIYRGCGYIMAACILLTFVYLVAPGLGEQLKAYTPIYWLESIAIVAFGISWLVKGEIVFKDKSEGGKKRAGRLR